MSWLWKVVSTPAVIFFNWSKSLLATLMSYMHVVHKSIVLRVTESIHRPKQDQCTQSSDTLSNVLLHITQDVSSQHACYMQYQASNVSSSIKTRNLCNQPHQWNIYTVSAKGMWAMLHRQEKSTTKQHLLPCGDHTNRNPHTLGTDQH